MELAPDVSVWQTGEGASNQMAVETAASLFPGMFVRFTDYSLYPRYGADAYYVETTQRAIAAGGHASGYLYPRPAMTDPATQVDNWFNSSPEINMAPMLDPEGPGMGGMSGGTLTQWIDEALARMAQRWPAWLPVWYTSRAFCNGYGVTRPSTPHLLMLAEYHYGYQVFDWASESTWTPHALGAYGGPDMPDGYDRSELALWQFTSSAQAPGFPGNIDMSMIWDWAVPQLLAGGSVATPTPAPPPTYHILQKQTPDGTVWLCAGLFRSPCTEEGLRQSLLDTGQLDPNLQQINPWSENSLAIVTPDIFVNMLGTVETAVNNVVGPVVTAIITSALQNWSPDSPTDTPAPAPTGTTPADPKTLTNGQLVDELGRRLGGGKAVSEAFTKAVAHVMGAPSPDPSAPPVPASRMSVPPEGPSKMAGSTYHNAPIEPPPDPGTPAPR